MAEQDQAGDERVPLRDHILALLREMDLRQQQRYDAQTKAVDAAFLAQQTAVQAALLSAEKAVQTALQAAEKAVTKAEVATEKRLEAMNEFRGALSDQTANLITRVEFDGLATRMRDLAARLDRTEGRSRGLNAGWGYLIAAVGLIGVVITIIAKIG